MQGKRISQMPWEGESRHNWALGSGCRSLHTAGETIDLNISNEGNFLPERKAAAYRHNGIKRWRFSHPWGGEGGSHEKWGNWNEG